MLPRLSGALYYRVTRRVEGSQGLASGDFITDMGRGLPG